MNINNLSKTILVSFALILFTALGLFWLEKTRIINLYNKPTSEVQITKIDNTNLATKRVETENKSINVPASVNPDSIKNYQLITDNEEYKIRKLGDEYTITLYAILNRPDQYENYKEQLKQYKYAALNYLKEQEVNINKAVIIYEPIEATNL